MSVGFASVQVLASFWGVIKDHLRFLALGRVAAILQGSFLGVAFLTLIIAFVTCDFSLLIVTLHDHTQLPWYYRFAATWGNHEGSLLLFVQILSGVGVAQAVFLHDPFLRARTLTIQGLLTILFLVFLLITSNPFTLLPFTLPEGKSLNPLLQDRGLLIHPPLLYLGYVGFSAPFSLAIAALWGGMDGKEWARMTRPWALLAWAALTAGITLGSWWAYYELGWGGWWFWDPVENASLMPWLAATALLHILRTESFYRWSLFLSLFTFGLSLLGTFLVRSGLITTVHSFVQDPERGIFLLSLLGGIMSFAFFLWVWKAPPFHSSPLPLFSRQGTILLNSFLFFIGLLTVILGTLYPLWSEYLVGKTVSIGAPYFERTFVPLMVPLLILIPIGSLLRDKAEPFFPLLMTPLTAALGGVALMLYLIPFPSLWAFTGIICAIWIIAGAAVTILQKRLSWGPTLAHIGVAISLLGVSVGGGFRTDETRILAPQESLEVGGNTLTLIKVEQGKRPTYLYERAIFSYGENFLTPEKRLYQPQKSLLSETAIYTNGFKDIYVILGPYQGENRWLIRASSIPLAPWIWVGGALMVFGVCLSFFRRKTTLLLLLLFLPTLSVADSDLEKRAHALSQEVRCPVCLGQSIADSEMRESEDLKAYILERLKEGESEDSIRETLRSRYGDEILFRPPFESHTLFLWLAPFGIFFLLLIGFLWKGFYSRARKGT